MLQSANFQINILLLIESLINLGMEMFPIKFPIFMTNELSYEDNSVGQK